jgi:hypothetical protein
MDKQAIRYTFRIVFLIVFLLGYSITTHEITHAMIYGYFDCKDITYGFHPTTLTFFTSADCTGIAHEDTMDLAQSINEIVGYSIMPFLVILVSILCLKD